MIVRIIHSNIHFTYRILKVKKAANLTFASFFRRGSVIVLFNLAFIGDITQDDLGINATNNLASAVTTGRLGELEVDPRSLSIFNTGTLQWINSIQNLVFLDLNAFIYNNEDQRNSSVAP